MATLADPTWVEYWLELGDVHVLDPRPSLDYNRGHLPAPSTSPWSVSLTNGAHCSPTKRWARSLAKQGWTNQSAPWSTTVPTAGAAR